MGQQYPWPIYYLKSLSKFPKYLPLSIFPAHSLEAFNPSLRTSDHLTFKRHLATFPWYLGTFQRCLATFQRLLAFSVDVFKNLIPNGRFWWFSRKRSGWTDWWIDRRTDEASYRDVRTYLKTDQSEGWYGWGRHHYTQNTVKTSWGIMNSAVARRSGWGEHVWQKEKEKETEREGERERERESERERATERESFLTTSDVIFFNHCF